MEALRLQERASLTAAKKGQLAAWLRTGTGLLSLPGSFRLSQMVFLARTLPISDMLAHSTPAREIPSTRLVQPHLAPAQPAVKHKEAALAWETLWLQKGFSPKRIPGLGPFPAISSPEKAWQTPWLWQGLPPPQSGIGGGQPQKARRAGV